MGSDSQRSRYRRRLELLTAHGTQTIRSEQAYTITQYIQHRVLMQGTKYYYRVRAMPQLDDQGHS